MLATLPDNLNSIPGPILWKEQTTSQKSSFDFHSHVCIHACVHKYAHACACTRTHTHTHTKYMQFKLKHLKINTIQRSTKHTAVCDSVTPETGQCIRTICSLRQACATEQYSVLNCKDSEAGETAQQIRAFAAPVEG